MSGPHAKHGLSGASPIMAISVPESFDELILTDLGFRDSSGEAHQKHGDR